jgi:hypothetical protein
MGGKQEAVPLRRRPPAEEKAAMPEQMQDLLRARLILRIYEKCTK